MLDAALQVRRTERRAGSELHDKRPVRRERRWQGRRGRHPSFLARRALVWRRHRGIDIGEAGIGKTALVDAFVQGQKTGVSREEEEKQKAKARPELSRRGKKQKAKTEDPAPNTRHLAPVFITHEQCIEHYGPGEAYLPVLEAVGQLCRQPGGERALGVLRRVAPSWLPQLPALLAEAERAALQQQVTGITRDRMLREMVEALETLSAERPLVLVLEDVHWSDASTIDLLNLLVRRREPARMLVLATSRQAELIVSDHPLKTLKQELVTRGYATEILLGGLQAAAVRHYVGRRLAWQADETGVGALVYQRTEGHPLFMVQLTDYLEQQGTLKVMTTTVAQEVASGIPQQLWGLIEAQVARLTAEEQLVLEAGSVAGAEFTIAGVAAALESSTAEAETVCEQLARRGQFLVECELSQWPDGTVSGRYGFRHALYQEILYQRLSTSRRARLHQQIGLREEAAYGERAKEIAAASAMHFERSRDAPRAVQYHTLAAQHAVRAHAHQEALSHITSALAFVPHIPDSAVRMQQELVLQTLRGVSLVSTQGFGRPEVEEAYERAHELSLQVANFAALAPVLFGLWNFWFVHADLERAHELAHQLDMLARRQDDPAMRGKAYTMAGQTYTMLGDFNAAFARFQHGLVIYDETRHGVLVRQYGEDAGVSSHNVMGSVCWILGFPDQARQHLLAGRQLAQRLAYPFLLAQNLWRSAVVLQCCGSFQELTERLQLLLYVSEAEGLPFWRAGGVVLQGWTLVREGQEAKGVALMQQGMDAWRATGAEIVRPYHLTLLAHAYGMSGQPEAGLRSVDEALQLVANTGERWWEAESYRLKGELTLQKGGLGIGEEEKQKAKVKSQKLPTPDP